MINFSRTRIFRIKKIFKYITFFHSILQINLLFIFSVLFYFFTVFHAARLLLNHGHVLEAPRSVHHRCHRRVGMGTTP